MSDVAPIPTPSFNEANIHKALVDARGDLYVAAELLATTVRALDRALRRSEELQGVFLSLREMKASRAYDEATTEQLEAEISRRMTVYRADALEALHELAVGTAPDAGYAQVKLAAASRLLATAGEGNNMGGDFAETLRALNERYHAEAPRIKVKRETIEIIPGNVIDVTPAGTQ